MTITTKNLELYFQHAPVADLTALAVVVTTGIVNGVIIEVAGAGLFEFQFPAVATPDGRDVIAGSGGGVWRRQTVQALTTVTDGRIAIGSLQTQQTPVQLTVNTNITGSSLTLDTPYIYESTAASTITLTLVGGGYSFRNPPALNGTPTTIGFNPGDVFTLTRYADTTILIS